MLGGILYPHLDHPRIRGEHIYDEIFPDNRQGSSPHPRGARGPGQPSDIDPRIIPASAGSTTSGAYMQYTSTDHPRIRGEHETWHRCLWIGE